MTNEETIVELAQKIYLALNAVYNDVTGSEETAFMNETIDWVNQYLQELELEADWSWIRTNGATLGTVSTATDTFTLAAGVQHLASSQLRDIVLTKTDGTTVTWRLVSPNQISNPAQPTPQQNRCTVIGRVLHFSRDFTDDEINGVITADTIGYLPVLSTSDISVLSLVDPQQLIVLGVAKNNVLPDVVNNQLTPNYTAKYADLLKKTIMRDGASTELDDTLRDDFSFIHGVY